MKEQLKATLEMMYDADDLVDILKIQPTELLDRFEDKFSPELYEEYCGMEAIKEVEDER